MCFKIITTLMLFFVYRSSLANIEQSMANLMREYQIPGAAICTLDHGKTSIHTFGITNKINNHPVTEQTVFEIGSITKIFTALLFVVTSSDPDQINEYLIKYYPELNKNAYLSKITFADLLTYTSGLGFGMPRDVNNKSQWRKYLLQWQPTYPIGSKWQYSNAAIGLVGDALEYKFNTSIGNLYVKHILQPLKMKPLYQYYLAQGYKENNEPARYSPGLFVSSGDIRSNIKDMSYVLNLAAGLSSQSKKLQEAMRTTQTPQFDVEGSKQQGLIWQIHSLKNKNLLNEPKNVVLGPLNIKPISKSQQIYDPNKLMDKTGATDGFKAYIAVIPETKTGIVILLNKYIPNGAIVNLGRKIILEELKGDVKN